VRRPSLADRTAGTCRPNTCRLAARGILRAAASTSTSSTGIPRLRSPCALVRLIRHNSNINIEGEHLCVPACLCLHACACVGVLCVCVCECVRVCACVRYLRCVRAVVVCFRERALPRYGAHLHLDPSSCLRCTEGQIVMVCVCVHPYTRTPLHTRGGSHVYILMRSLACQRGSILPLNSLCS
jgi:hypothetical protein